LGQVTLDTRQRPTFVLIAWLRCGFENLSAKQSSGRFQKGFSAKILRNCPEILWTTGHPLFDVPEEPLQADPAGPGASWCYDLEHTGGCGSEVKNHIGPWV